MFVALYILVGVYLFYRDRELLIDLRKFILLQALALVTIIACRICIRDQWQVEMLPLLMFGMTATLAYRQEVTLLLSAAVSLVCVMAFGLGVADFVIFAATMAAIVLLLRDVRSRTKLIYIGLAAAVVAFLTSMGSGIVTGEAAGPPLLASSAWSAFLAVLAGMFITALLPWIEKLFEFQTEISLLELGDVSHALLQELVRRAPGTYNHSINVASIAEAAAESIGANGLLLRVGAYFHDIGKMLKPQYFVENQGTESNRHEDLLPAMSTLIIIAHVKDGADLARQHHLPQPLIDLIQQHHGTTLVEYFYNRANQQVEDDPDASEVDEGSYRYPGPKPQTREAAVLMLADAVESASRSLTEPAPARIESLVHDIAMKKLMDGQFDECGLTLQELNQVEDSLVKSLTAVYHGRVKYPDQQTA
ncbi:MAG: HDIG domain-containing metalloprotein [Planctomycetota bacterium]